MRVGCVKTKSENMKKIAFVVLILAAVAIAEEENVEKLAKKFETDVQTLQKCLDEAETTAEEIFALKSQLKKAHDEDVDEDTKKAIAKHSKFIACLLEQKEMMVDSKLMVDKILDVMIAEKPDLANKEGLKECITALNVHEEFNREDKAMGLMMCMTSSFDDDDEEKK